MPYRTSSRLLRNSLAALAFLLAMPAGGFSAEPIKLGAILSVTGPASFLGEPEANTLKMLQDSVNAKGGVLGRPIEITVYDDEADVNKAVLAADKLLKKDQVAACLGPSTTPSTLAVTPKFAGAKVPLVSCAAAEKIVNPVNPFVFKTPQSDRHAILKIFGHASKAGFKKLALLTVSDGFGQAGREVLKEMAPAKGFELVADEVFGPKDTDMTAQLTKIKEAKPDAIICWGTNPGPAVVARNRVQLGLTTPLYMSHGVASKKFIELAAESAEGIFLPAGFLTVVDTLDPAHPQKAVLTEYAKSYQERFKAPVSTFGGYAHDALMLTLKAIEMGKSDKPEDIRNNLEKIKGFVGVTGVFTFSPEDHNGLNEDSFTMVVIKNGDFQILK